MYAVGAFAVVFYFFEHFHLALAGVWANNFGGVEAATPIDELYVVAL